MEYPETHQTGMLEVTNPLDRIVGCDLSSVDFGLQVAPDGRVWVCINGVAFIRFKPERKPARA